MTYNETVWWGTRYALHRYDIAADELTILPNSHPGLGILQNYEMHGPLLLGDGTVMFRSSNSDDDLIRALIIGNDLSIATTVLISHAPDFDTYTGKGWSDDELSSGATDPDTGFTWMDWTTPDGYAVSSYNSAGTFLGGAQDTTRMWVGASEGDASNHFGTSFDNSNVSIHEGYLYRADANNTGITRYDLTSHEWVGAQDVTDWTYLGVCDAGVVLRESVAGGNPGIRVYDFADIPWQDMIASQGAYSTSFADVSPALEWTATPPSGSATSITGWVLRGDSLFFFNRRTGGGPTMWEMDLTTGTIEKVCDIPLVNYDDEGTIGGTPVWDSTDYLPLGRALLTPTPTEVIVPLVPNLTGAVDRILTHFQGLII